jgi:hypothetical protein
MSNSEDHLDSSAEGDDLFGDGDDDAPQSDRSQPASDAGLDSDREDAPRDLDDAEDDDAGGFVSRTIMGMQMYRHNVPKPKDGIVSLAQLP